MNRIEQIEQQIDAAARSLQPLVIHGTPDVARKAHDALNALASARLNVGLLEETIKGA